MEKTVRDAAAALHKAITDARATGYVIAWPANSDGLPAIAISETGKVKKEEPMVPKTFGKLGT